MRIVRGALRRGSAIVVSAVDHENPNRLLLVSHAPIQFVFGSRGIGEDYVHPFLGKTESWLGKQNHGWENRTMAGETESWLGILIVRCVFVFFCAFLWLILPKKSGNPGFPGLPPMDYSFTCR